MSQLEQKLKAFAEKQIQAFSVDLDENVNLSIGYYPEYGYIIADMIDIERRHLLRSKLDSEIWEGPYAAVKLAIFTETIDEMKKQYEKRFNYNFQSKTPQQNFNILLR